MSDKTLTLYPLAVELYKKIRGRTTAYYQYPDELGNKIGPAKEPKWITTKSGKKKNIGSDYPLEIETYIQHLNGEKTIGIYPHNEKDNCFFLVFDIDCHKSKKTKKLTKEEKKRIKEILEYKKKNNFKNIRKIQKRLWKDYKLPSYIEKSGSPKSYHLWIFLEETPGDKIVAFGNHVIKSVGFTKTSGQKTTVEIRPEQGKASETKEKYGTVIKCPCGIHATTKNRSQFYMPKDHKNPIDDLKLIKIRKKRIKKDSQKLALCFGNIIPVKLPELPELSEIEEKDQKEQKEKEQKEKEEEYDDTSLSGMLSKQLHCVDVSFALYPSLVPDKFKFQAGRNILFDGYSNEMVVEYFRNHPDYKRFTSTVKVEEVRQEIIEEIYEQRSENKKDKKRVKKDEIDIRKEITVNLRKGYYKGRKTPCSEMKKICGDHIRKNICLISCEIDKVTRSSARKLSGASAIKGTIFLLLKPVWKIINVEKNRHKIEEKKNGKIRYKTYVHVSKDELDKIIKEHPEFCIDSRSEFIKDMIRVSLISISTDGRNRKTFENENYEGSKYRFKRDEINEILNKKK